MKPKKILYVMHNTGRETSRGDSATMLCAIFTAACTRRREAHGSPTRLSVHALPYQHLVHFPVCLDLP